MITKMCKIPGISVSSIIILFQEEIPLLGRLSLIDTECVPFLIKDHAILLYDSEIFRLLAAIKIDWFGTIPKIVHSVIFLTVQWKLLL